MIKFIYKKFLKYLKTIKLRNLYLKIKNKVECITNIDFFRITLMYYIIFLFTFFLYNTRSVIEKFYLFYLITFYYTQKIIIIIIQFFL